MAGKKAAKPKAKAKVKTEKSTVTSVPKKLIDRANDDDTKSPAKIKPTRDDNAQIRKIVYDNFQALSDEEIYLLEVEGKNLFDTLAVDRARWRKGELEMGATYYAEKREKHQSATSALALLKPADATQPEDDALRAALEAVVSSKANIQQYVEWTELAASVNNLNLVAACRQALKMHPSRFAEYLQFGMSTLKMFRRLELHVTFKAVFDLMIPYFDKCLVASFTTFKAKDKSPSFWWRIYGYSAALVVPEAACSKAISLEEDEWATVAAEVKIVFDSSDVGKMIFRPAMRQIELNAVASVVQLHMDKLKDKDIDNALLVATRDAFVVDMKARGGNPSEVYAKPKDIDCRYRDVPSLVQCSSPMDQLNMRIEAFVRGLAVDKGLIDPMWCENELVGLRPVPAVTISPDVVLASANFRVALMDGLKEEDATAANIEDTIKSNCAFLKTIDCKCRIELAFWSSSIGENARARLQAAILDRLPSEGSMFSIDSSLLKLKGLKDSKLVTFAGSSLAAVLTTIIAFVANLQASTAPHLDKAGTSTFITTVKTRLALFLSFTEPASSKATITTLYGRDAALKIFSKVTKGKHEDVVYLDVLTLLAFGWLLDFTKLLLVKKLCAEMSTRSLSTDGPVKARPLKMKRMVSAADSKAIVANLFKL